MRLTDDASEFLSAPVGRCIGRRSFLVWCARPDLSGIILWGAPGDGDVQELVRLLDFGLNPEVQPTRAVLVDCRDVEHADGDTLLGFGARARERMPEWSPRIGREAVLLPSGLRGLLLAGAIASLGPQHPLRFAREPDQAFDYVAHPDARSALASAGALALETRGASALVDRLRNHLSNDLVNASLDGCAAALGLSGRTLQRELHRRDTSFSDELRRARVAAAGQLLRMTDLKMEAIAQRVGFGTASRMSAMLRRELSATPSMVRAGGPAAPGAFAG